MRIRTACWVLSGLGLLVACGGSTSTGGTGGAGAGAGTAGSAGASAASGTGGGGGSVGGSGGAIGGSGGAVGGSAGSGAVSSYDDCEQPGECTLFAKNCCGGYCGPSMLSEWLAVNSSMLGQVQNSMCDDLVACPDCITHDEPHYIAACRSGTCVGVDIRDDAISACNTATDCRLRWGSDCCESCGPGPGELISVNKNGALEQAVCSPFTGACPPCAPPEYPAGATAACIDGHCSVVWAD